MIPIIALDYIFQGMSKYDQDMCSLYSKYFDISKYFNLYYLRSRETHYCKCYAFMSIILILTVKKYTNSQIMNLKPNLMSAPDVSINLQHV